MQYIQRYNLKRKKASEYVAWLQKNASVLSKDAPTGWKYLGTWFTVRNLGSHQCETRWELDDYAALGAGFGTETFQNLNRELFEFLDDSRIETCLMKSESDIRMPKGF